MPTILEYFSYVFHFQALMAGPVIVYRDYIDFIHGHHLPGAKSLAVRIKTLMLMYYYISFRKYVLFFFKKSVNLMS